MTIKEQMLAQIEALKSMPIKGCITGSCMIPGADFDAWMIQPDIDVFCYSRGDMINTVNLLTYELGYELGLPDRLDHDDKSREQQMKLFEWTIEGRRNKDAWVNLHTVKMRRDGLCINVTYKDHQNSIIKVLGDFDMSIIMIGWDIPTGKLVDMRNIYGEGSTDVAIPNKAGRRAYNLSAYGVAYWVRQFDRVVKYSDRGFDTTPMARWYIEEIDKVIKTGSIWTSEAAMTNYESIKADLEAKREIISRWLEAKEEA